MNTPATAQPLLPPAQPQELGLCPQRTAHLQAVLQAEVERGRLPGAVALVARHGRLALFESVGVLNPNASTPVAMPLDAIFRLYSMTKPIVSVAAMLLVERGELLLGDALAKYLPEFGQPQVAHWVAEQLELRPAQQNPSVQDLLRHTAGLTYEFMGNTPVHRQYAQMRTDSRSRSNAELAQVLAGLPLMYEPGTAWEYGRATDVLGRVIEVISGESLGSFLQQHIFSPLGMTDTRFAVAPAQQHRIAEPFARDPEGGLQMRMTDVRQAVALESGGGGLVGTALDYARFLQCLLNRGTLGGVRLLGSQTVAWMTSDQLGHIPVASPAGRALLSPGHGFGLGFAVRTAAAAANVPGSVGTYFWGGLAGTTFFVDPAQDLFAILMLQAPNQRDHYRMLFRNLVYACLVN